MIKLKDKTLELDAAIGARIKSARSAKGVSQESLADHLGITFQQVQKYEKGTNRVGAGTLILIAEKLGVSALYLLRGCENDTALVLVGMDASAMKAARIVNDLPMAAKRGAILALDAIRDALTSEAEAA